MTIKVCGITSIEEALALYKEGVNYIGFILFYSQWRRMELCLNY